MTRPARYAPREVGRRGDAVAYLARHRVERVELPRIDAVITQPPAWPVNADGGAIRKGCLGTEPTFGQYLDHLVGILRRVREACSPTASAAVMLEDYVTPQGVRGLAWAAAHAIESACHWPLRSHVSIEEHGQPIRQAFLYGECNSVRWAQHRWSFGADDVAAAPFPPLSRDLARTLVAMVSHPGDMVCDPFAGVASVGAAAIEFGRSFVGCEPRHDSHALAVRTLQRAIKQSRQPQRRS